MTVSYLTQNLKHFILVYHYGVKLKLFQGVRSIKSRLFTFLFVFLLAISFVGHRISTVSCVEVHDVAITGFVVFPGSGVFVPPNMPINANVTVENQGTTDESCNVTLYFGNVTIETITVTNLQAGSETNVTFEWFTFPFRAFIFPPPWEDPMEVMHVNVTMKGVVDVVPGEVDTVDNVYIDGVIHALWLLPDVDGDGRIAMRDIGFVARAYASYPGHIRWKRYADFNSDEIIDMKDIGISARTFGSYYG